MARRTNTDVITRKVTGGLIRGSDGQPAFTLAGPEPSANPVLIAVPHAGRTYTSALLDRMRHPQLAGLRLEDRHVDALARQVADACGATLLVAEAPRALIDLNRAPEDVDWTMIRGDAAARRVLGDTPGRRVRAGLGLIPRRLPGIGEIWRGLHEEADLAARIADVHAPYHATLASELARLRARWGAALLVDLHSMPPLPREGGALPAEFVIGDRYGASCDGELTAAAFRCLAANARPAAHNRPYAGGYVLERHGRPRDGVHALQIEIDRSSYLDSRLMEAGEGFDDVARLLAGLVSALGEATAALGNASWAEAAE